MGIKWSDDLSVGAGLIDDQHRELIARLDALIEEMGGGGGEDSCGDLLGFLEKYIVEHFSEEESYMVRYGYDGLAAHQKEHEAFFPTFAGFKERHEQEGATPMMVIQLQRWLYDWLRDHIRTTDRAFGAFLKKVLPE